MSISLPNGAQIAIATSYAAAAPITSISNSTSAEVTADNTLTEGDMIEVTCGWPLLTEKVVRAKSVTPATFILDGIDTGRETKYPIGSSAGTFRKINGWTSLSQILSSSSSGGEQQFLEYQFLESDTQKRIPTFKNAAGLTFTVADDATQAGYLLAAEANEDRRPRAVRITLPNGGVLLYNAYISMNKTPKLSVNEIMSVDITLSLLTEPVRY